jgi:thiol-disulfide isomerase/thioredoxin
MASFDRKMLKKLLVGIGTILVLMPHCFIGCGGAESSGDQAEAEVVVDTGEPERFALRNIYRKKYQWSDFIGRPFMINFWATWCGPCRAEIPVLRKLYSEYQPNGLEIVAISLDTERTKDQVVPFIDSYKIPWIVLYGDIAVAQEFNLGQSIPVTLFFNAEGNEVSRLTGAQPERIFRQELEKLFP